MLKQIPQENDIWRHVDGGHMRVERIETTVNGVKACITWIDKSGDLRAMLTTLEHLQQTATLVERDGKPYPELRVGAWYPVMFDGGECRALARYSVNGNLSFDDLSWKPDELDWIGPEIKIEWPEDPNSE